MVEYDDPTDLGLPPVGGKVIPFCRRSARRSVPAVRTPRPTEVPTGSLGPVTPDATPSARHRQHMDAIYHQMGWDRHRQARERQARALRCRSCGAGPSERCSTLLRGRRRELEESHSSRLDDARVLEKI